MRVVSMVLAVVCCRPRPTLFLVALLDQELSHGPRPHPGHHALLPRSSRPATEPTLSPRVPRYSRDCHLRGYLWLTYLDRYRLVWPRSLRLAQDVPPVAQRYPLPRYLPLPFHPPRPPG